MRRPGPLSVAAGICLCALMFVDVRHIAAQRAVFSSRIETVRIDVSVLQGSQPVRGLAAGDFEVLDNGVPQQVTLLGFEETPVNVVLALDMSGSLRGPQLGQLRAAGARIIQALGEGDMGALVAFTDYVSIRSGFTSDKTRLLDGLNQPALGTDTSLVDATHAAIVLAESQVGRPLVIVFSDGADTSSALPADVALDTARRTGPVVYVVTSPKADRGGFLDDIVRLTGGRRVDVSSLDRLSDAFDKIFGESRQRYLLSFTPAGVQGAGWHELTVRVRGRRADVRARPGYLAR